MTGVEESVAGVGCFQRFLKCCSSQTDDQTDGNEVTDVNVELTFVCCGGNNEKNLIRSQRSN